jgi:hypothetical protein
MAASCALDQAGLRLQLQRYRTAGQDARLIERTSRRLVVEFAAPVQRRLVDELVAVERECCPYFTLDWRPDRRRLAVSVSEAEHEPALDAIGFALAVD